MGTASLLGDPARADCTRSRCVLHRLLHRAFGDLHTLAADIDAGLIHHREHGAQTFVFAPDQLADAIAMIAIAHHAGGRGVDAELMLQANAAQIVARAKLSFRPHQIFGHQEQRNSAAPLRCIGQASENEVEDILGKLVLAPGDEDLLPGNAIFPSVFTLRDWSCRAAQRADIAASLRFGEVHRSDPLAADQLWQELGLLLFAAVF